MYFDNELLKVFFNYTLTYEYKALFGFIFFKNVLKKELNENITSRSKDICTLVLHKIHKIEA